MSKSLPTGKSAIGYIRAASHIEGSDVSAEAAIINLEQCYLCAKKHVQAAKTMFREYHTGYSNHIKNLINSLRIAEDKIREAFLLWQNIMGELNMAEAELLGRSVDGVQVDPVHVELANSIRSERIALSDDTLYVPDFDKLLVAIHSLQFSVLDRP